MDTDFDSIPQQMYSNDTGNFWLPIHYAEDPVLNYIKNGSLFDSYIVDNCKLYITPGSTVIDVGSNFGQMCIQWSRLVGPNGHVHGFECSEFVLYFLKKTLLLNDHAKNVVIHENAAWHTAGEVLNMLIPDGSPLGQFYSGMGVKGSVDRDSRNMTTHNVVSTTLDSFDYENRVSVIKIDAQGSDFHVVKGAENTIRKHKPLLTFEYEPEYDNIFGVSFVELDSWLQSIGYIQRPDIFQNNHDFFYTHKD